MKTTFHRSDGLGGLQSSNMGAGDINANKNTGMNANNIAQRRKTPPGSGNNEAN